jgi:hypothetical protein
VDSPYRAGLACNGIVRVDFVFPGSPMPSASITVGYGQMMQWRDVVSGWSFRAAVSPSGMVHSQAFQDSHVLSGDVPAMQIGQAHAGETILHEMPAAGPLMDILPRLRLEAREWEQACARAAGLLLSHLTPGQIQEWDTLGYFSVRGSAGGEYRIGPGSLSNVRQRVEENRARALCAVPAEALPMPDIHFAQMMMIRADEPGFLAVAVAGDPIHEW